MTRLLVVLRRAGAAVLALTAAVGAGAAPAGASTGDPTGQVDELRAEPGQVSARGWALDTDAPGSPVIVQMYVDGTQSTMAWAGAARPDVAAAVPGAGADHGYTLTLAASPGPHTVCVYGVNVGPGTSATLGCRTVVVPGHDPIGQLDRVVEEPGRVVVGGWAVDPDTGDALVVQVYVDWMTSATGVADRDRHDVAAALPWAGAARGYEVAIDAPPGDHTVCVFAINTGPGSSDELGCRRTTVPGHDPIGNVDDLSLDGGRVTARGWAVDPDTASAIIVQMYVDGASTMVWADASRGDVGAALPWAGPQHGFTVSLDAGPGAHQVCVFAINTGPGTSRSIGCRLISGPPFFVYGSLRTGQSGYYLLAGRTVSQTLTRMPGLDMYRRTGSAYPYAVPNGASTTGIVGEVMEISAPLYASTVASLDRYERYDPGLPPDNQVYVRELRPTAGGRPAWVYVAGTRQAQYLRSVGILVTSGDFLRW